MVIMGRYLMFLDVLYWDLVRLGLIAKCRNAWIAMRCLSPTPWSCMLPLTPDDKCTTDSPPNREMDVLIN